MSRVATAESAAWRRSPATASGQWLRPADAARLARRERVRITVRPDGSVEYDGTAQKAEIAGGHATLAEEHEQQGGQKIRRSIGGRSEER